MPRLRNQISPPAQPPSHRRLILGAVIVIILGAGFLFFWQAVLRFAFEPEPTWDLDFCEQLLTRHAPELGEIELSPEASENRTFRAAANIYGEMLSINVLAEGIEDVVLGCEAEIVSSGSRLGDVGDPYECEGVIVRYNSDVTDDWQLIIVQMENTIPGNPTPFIDLITYYNPAAPQVFEARLRSLQSHSCVI